MTTKPSRTHRFTLNQRIAILDEYEATDHGMRGGVLRRYDITAATISRWAKARREGLLLPSEKKESTRALTRSERAELNRLNEENADLKARLAQSESTVEVLGKASALLEALAKSATAAPQEPRRASGPAGGHRYIR